MMHLIHLAASSRLAFGTVTLCSYASLTTHRVLRLSLGLFFWSTCRLRPPNDARPSNSHPSSTTFQSSSRVSAENRGLNKSCINQCPSRVNLLHDCRLS